MRLLPYGFAILLIATPLSALTTYPGASRVRVTSAVGAPIQLAEISVTDNNGIDVALASAGATAFAPTQADALSGAGRAIDGATNGYGASGAIYRSSGAFGDYLDVTLSHRITLSAITLYGRTDAEVSGNVFGVEVFDNFGRALFAGTIDARFGPKTDWFDVVGTPVVPGPLPLAFNGMLAGAIPEPASWALFVVGFGLVGASVRRRRPSTAIA